MRGGPARRNLEDWIVGQQSATIVWFRNDLRVHDHPALTAAAAKGEPVIPVYILDDSAPWPMGGASKWWLHHSLTKLSSALRKLGSPLILRRGAAASILEEIVQETGASSVVWSRQYDAETIAFDARVARTVSAAAVDYPGVLLHDPVRLKTGDGGPYRVFTPFLRAMRATCQVSAPLPAPISLRPPPQALSSDDLSSWGLTPRRPDWASGFTASWQPGEDGARDGLETFLSSRAGGYASNRDIFAVEGTSRLSAHLRFGEISPRTVWHATQARLEGQTGAEKFLAEIGWREFSYHLLHHFPSLPRQNLRREFDHFPWADDAAKLKAWQHGRTGVPAVDAGMRELWTTGWMHNRARMICASFLVKNLLIDWRHGAAWFWDTLVDADLANNSASWQWVAGCGADAAPFFRIFNPVLQARKFDPDGTYVRRWIPELTKLSDKDVHEPWAAESSKLRAADVSLGHTYPRPIVDLGSSRARALAAFAGLRNAA
jgi:deoxyribodipyrimidine photo-lyase